MSKVKSKVVNFRVTENEKSFIDGFQKFMRSKSSNANLTKHSEATLFMNALQDFARKEGYVD
jgi:hypothetical protein